jgi:hypothetical protein
MSNIWTVLGYVVDCLGVIASVLSIYQFIASVMAKRKRKTAKAK